MSTIDRRDARIATAFAPRHSAGVPRPAENPKKHASRILLRGLGRRLDGDARASTTTATERRE
jgi:hypothetical protein